MHITDEYPALQLPRRPVKVSRVLESVAWVALGCAVLVSGLHHRHAACLHPQHQEK